MTKRQVLRGTSWSRSSAAGATAALDLTVVRRGHRAGRVADRRGVRERARADHHWLLRAERTAVRARRRPAPASTTRVVAITFDDGPSPDITPRVLDALRDADARATFFILGRHAEQHPKIVERIAREGHEIANHAYSHGILVFAGAREMSREQLRTHRLLLALGRPAAAAVPGPARLPKPRRRPRPAPARLPRRRLDERRVRHREPGADVIVGARAALPPGRDPPAARRRRQRQGRSAARRPRPCRDPHARRLPATARHRVGARDARSAQTYRSVAHHRLSRSSACCDRDRHLPAHRPAADDGGRLRLVVGDPRPDSNSLVLFKAVVWKTGLDTIPDHPRFTYRQVVPAIFIGFLLNTLLPARIGEIARVAVLQRRLKLVGTEVPTATIAGSVVAEQIVLAIALVVIMALQLPFVNVPARFEHMILAFGGVIIVVLLAVIGLEMFSRRSRRRPRRTWRSHAGNRRSPCSSPSRAACSAARRCCTACGRPLRPGCRARLLGLSIGGIYAALAAADIDPSIGMAGLVFLVSTLVQLFPFCRATSASSRLRSPRCCTGLSDRFPARDRLCGRPAGDRGFPRRRNRLLVPLARRSVALGGPPPARRRLRTNEFSELGQSRLAPARDVPSREGARGEYPRRYPLIWAGILRLGRRPLRCVSRSPWQS